MGKASMRSFIKISFLVGRDFNSTYRAYALSPILKNDAIGANAVISCAPFNSGKYARGVRDKVTINIALEAVAE